MKSSSKLETVNLKQTQMFKAQNSKPYGAYQATLMTPKQVIPAKAGIQRTLDSGSSPE
jgi:hypothetical protein